jgi:hypothetical protein
LTARHLEKSRTGFQQAPRQMATICYTVSRRTDTGGIGDTTRSLVKVLPK